MASKAPRIDWRRRALELQKQVEDLQAQLDRKIGLCWEPPSPDTYAPEAAAQALPLRLRLEPALSLPAHDRGNLILEGDNLLALRLLHRTHRGRIDAIFIDPPYNTGNTSSRPSPRPPRPPRDPRRLHRRRNPLASRRPPRKPDARTPDWVSCLALSPRRQ